MTVPMKTLQRADRLLGRPAMVLLRPFVQRRRVPETVRRVLLVKFWGIGSLQLLTPAVHVLRTRHPEARLELLTLLQNRELARGLEVFDEVHTLDLAAGWGRLMARVVALLARMRRRSFDLVYDFEFFTCFSAVLSVLCGAKASAGFAAPYLARRGLHTEWTPFRRSWHVARNFRALAGGENGRAVEAGDLRPFRVEPGHRAEAAARLLESGLRPGPLVVLNPNAGHLSLERRWPPERFAALARALVLEDGASVCLIGSAAERGRCLEVRVRAGELPHGGLVDLSGRLSVGGLCALLDGARAVVTNDSGPMHLAAALGTPTFGLFGPETPVMYRPLGARAHALWNPPACSPCLNVHDNKLGGCFRGRPECMTNLSVGAVLAAVREELGVAAASEPLSSPR